MKPIDILFFTSVVLIGLVILHYCPPRIGHPSWEAIAGVGTFGAGLAWHARGYGKKF